MIVVAWFHVSVKPFYEWSDRHFWSYNYIILWWPTIFKAYWLIWPVYVQLMLAPVLLQMSSSCPSICPKVCTIGHFFLKEKKESQKTQVQFRPKFELKDVLRWGFGNWCQMFGLLGFFPSIQGKIFCPMTPIFLYIKDFNSS